MANKMNISIPKELADKIEKKIKETNFNSVSDYIIYILRQVISEKAIVDEESEQIYSKEEEEGIMKNLKDMGYL